MYAYNGITGPDSFGTGGRTGATSGTGQNFGLNGSNSGGNIYVPEGYITNSALNGSTTFANKTLASLGLTLGTYTYFKTSDGTLAATVTVVPEPGTLALLSTSLLPLGTLLMRRKRQQRNG